MNKTLLTFNLLSQIDAITEELRNGKTADAGVIDKTKSVLGWDNRYYPTSPFAMSLATGIAGAGLGYGAASATAPLLGEEWDKKGWKRRGLLYGALLGAAPGALEMLKSVVLNRSVLDGSHMQAKHSDFGIPTQRWHSGPIISGEELMKTVWTNPGVSNRLSPHEQSLITGVVGSTQQIAGSSYITPHDVGRLAVGMGVGYLQGTVAGKIIGALTGLPPSAQKTLANTGMYAGALKSTLPILFGQTR
jgi:hypothetical protein